MRVVSPVLVHQEPRHDRDAHAARHQLLDGIGVVGAHHGIHCDVELGQRRRQDALGGDAAVLRDQRAPGQIGHLERPAERRQLVAGGHHQYVGVAQDLGRLQPGDVVDDRRQRQIEVARRETLQQLVGAVALLDMEHDVGCLQPQRDRKRRDDDAGDAEDRAEPDDTGDLGGVGAEVAVGLDEALADGRGMGQQPAAGVGQIDVPRARRAHQQLDPDDALERADLLADGRLGVAEPLGRAAHRPRLGDGGEGAQVTQVDLRPVSRSGDARDDSPTCSEAPGPRCSRRCASS